MSKIYNYYYYNLLIQLNKYNKIELIESIRKLHLPFKDQIFNE